MGGFKKDKVEKAFKTKGTERAYFNEVRAKDHIYYYFIVNGVDVGIWTKVSHGSGKSFIGDNLLSMMAKQLHIKKQIMNEYFSCTKDCEDINKILVASGDI